MLEKLRDNFPYFARKCLKIRTKEGDIKPFILNKAQLYFYKLAQEQLAETGRVRLVVVKGRQQGLSTVIQAVYFWQTIFRKGVRTYILTHEKNATENLFGMTKRYYDHYPLKDFMNTKEDSSTSLFFEGRESGYKIGTAGNKAVGRSQTIQLFHGSEAAFWPHAAEHAAGILQAIPDVDGTYVIFESTANGIGNFFYDKYRDSLSDESEFNLVFIPWYWQAEYSKPIDHNFHVYEEEQAIMDMYGITKEQLNWRRQKIRELHTTGIDGALLFKQEYPNDAEEAFIATSYDSYLDVVAVKKAMAYTDHIEAYGPLILGVDPSGSGKDKTGFALRRGRELIKAWTMQTTNTMEVVGEVVNLLKRHNIDYAFIDKIGVGAGVYDRLAEMGYSGKVQSVSASEAATNKDLYHNLRAEMWARLKEWLEDEPVKMQDNPELLNQLVSVGYKANSRGALLMESKDDIKKDGRPSPDLGDAVTYTFAKPVNLHSNKAIAYPKRMGIC